MTQNQNRSLIDDILNDSELANTYGTPQRPIANIQRAPLQPNVVRLSVADTQTTNSVSLSRPFSYPYIPQPGYTSQSYVSQSRGYDDVRQSRPSSFYGQTNYHHRRETEFDTDFEVPYTSNHYQNQRDYRGERDFLTPTTMRPGNSFRRSGFSQQNVRFVDQDLTIPPPHIDRVEPGVYPDPPEAGENGNNQNILDSSILQDVRAGATRQFYLGLPAPWNVLPRIATRRLEDQKQLQIASIDKFDGNKAKYFIWRALVIEHIHKANISITEKINAMRNACDTKCEELSNLFMLTIFKPPVYKEIIETLEQNYGGDARAKNVYLGQLLKPGLKYDNRDLAKMRNVKSRLNQYVICCRSCDDEATIYANGTYKDVMITFFNRAHEAEFLKYSRENKLPETLPSILLWITDEIEMQDKMDTTSIFRTAFQQKFGQGSLRKQNSGSKTLEHGEEKEIDETDNAESVEEHGNEELSHSDVESDHDRAIDALVNSGYKFPICKLHELKNEREERHLLFLCDHFKEMSVSDRHVWVRRNKLCRNCLSPNHKAFECRSNRTCGKAVCGKRHHTLLHFG